jgi:hypothetical protein
MRPTTLRRLEALEKGHRSREQRELSASLKARVYIWQIVLGYYLGGLKSDEDEGGVFRAEERALNYKCGDYCKTLSKVTNDRDIEAMSEFKDRYNDAYRRLFAKVGLDFDNTPRNILFDALVTMVDQFPDQWLNWLRSNLQQWCPDAEIAVGSNLPRRLSDDNAFTFARESKCHQNSTRKR